MGDDPLRDRLNELDARLRTLKQQDVSEPRQTAAMRPGTGYGIAFRIATDLVGGLVGGALFGWLVDQAFGTAPWGILGMFLLGAVAGMWNVYRTARGYDASAGFRAPPQPAEGSNGTTRKSADGRPEKNSGD